MRYVRSKYNQYKTDQAYRIYITDSLYANGQGKALTARYYDLIHPKEIDPRSGDEIALDVINRLGLKVD